MKTASMNLGRAKALLMSLLVVGAAITVLSAANLPWIYDTSRRVEPVPSSEMSVSCSLDAKPVDEELSNGCNLSSLPLGVLLLVR